MSAGKPAPLAEQLDTVIERIRVNFAAKHAAREQALTGCREVIRHSSMTIRAIHRGEREEAARLLGVARARMTEVQLAAGDHPDILNAGFIHDAQKELAEAAITIALICDEALPDPESLQVQFAAYLNGMCEAVGELRRFLLDGLRHGDMDRSERYLAAMDEIYALMVTIDYPDAITGGLRRSTDVTRGILEKTRGDLTLAARQRDLERRIAGLQASLGNGLPVG